MVDCVGKELKIGDKVICSDMNYADLLIGEVIGFTPKKIRVKYHRSINGFDFRKDQLKHPYQVFKYEEVVRCKDCKEWGGVVYGGRCKRWSAPLSKITKESGASHKQFAILVCWNGSNSLWRMNNEEIDTRN